MSETQSQQLVIEEDGKLYIMNNYYRCNTYILTALQNAFIFIRPQVENPLPHSLKTTKYFRILTKITEYMFVQDQCCEHGVGV